MIQLALYKAKGDFFNRLIRWRTSSPYSHCELVVDGVSYSASLRDGGVRAKNIEFAPQNWDFVPLPDLGHQSVFATYAMTLGHGYDFWGAALGRGLDVPIQDREKWFCSEWCAYALGFSEPWRFSPATLAAVFRRK